MGQTWHTWWWVFNIPLQNVQAMGVRRGVRGVYSLSEPSSRRKVEVYHGVSTRDFATSGRVPTCPFIAEVVESVRKRVGEEEIETVVVTS